MTYRDKSYKTGHDELDKEIIDAYEKLQREVPMHQMRRIEHRIHDGILQVMKNNSQRICRKPIQHLQDCVNEHSILQWSQCGAARDALNECYRDQNNEENYQRIRLQFLRGELFEQYKGKTKAKIEMYKTLIPGLPIDEGKAAFYAERICDSSENIGSIATLENAPEPKEKGSEGPSGMQS